MSIEQEWRVHCVCVNTLSHNRLRHAMAMLHIDWGYQRCALGRNTSQHSKHLLIFTETKCGHSFPIDYSANGGQNLFDHFLGCSFADVANEHCDDRAIALRWLIEIIVRLIFIIHLWMLIDGWTSSISGCWRWLWHQRWHPWRHHLKYTYIQITYH